VDPKALFERFGRRPEPSACLKSALEDLERLVPPRPDLARPAEALARVLTAAFLHPDPTVVPPATLEAMADARSAGLVAFQAVSPVLDRGLLNGRGRALAEVLGGDNPRGLELAAAIRGRRVDLARWAGEVLAGRPESVEAGAAEAKVEPTLAASVLRFSLLPTLARVSEALEAHRPGMPADRGDCPHCGSRPLLAESRGLEQRIVFRCGLCASAWPGERLSCPSCGESGAKALHYSFIEGEQERFRLAHCDTCRYDWKVVSTLTPLSPPSLIVADLASVHLDVLAADPARQTP